MTEDGSEREHRGLASMDSIESRWVYQDEEGSEIDNDGDDRASGGLESPQRDSDDEDNAEQKLIRTGPRIDSFDVEALEVPGAHRNDFDVRFHSFKLIHSEPHFSYFVRPLSLFF